MKITSFTSPKNKKFPVIKRRLLTGAGYKLAVMPDESLDDNDINKKPPIERKPNFGKMPVDKFFAAGPSEVKTAEYKIKPIKFAI